MTHMKKVLVFAGSNNSKSINQRLASYAASFLINSEPFVIELKDFSAPLFNIDIEKNEGFPASMIQLSDLFNKHDGFIISLPEYNSSVTPVFKNTVDWISRIELPIFRNKPMLLLSTSMGKRGGKTNLENIVKLVPFWGAKNVVSYSLPSFNENMTIDNELSNPEEKSLLLNAVKQFEINILKG